MRIFSKRTSDGQRSRPAAPRALRRRLDAASTDGEQGFLLIEVMVSAMLVALIAVGTFTAFDVSGRITAEERARAQATALAQQDQERLRGLGSEELANLSESKKVELEEKTKQFTVVSKSQFVSDTAGTASCSSAGATADYYETTSEVTWPALNKARPAVVETGLVAPPAGGELSVTVNDGRGGKVSGMAVSGTGVSSFSGTTGSNGCLIFGPLEEGAYKLHATQAGYVTPQGESEPKESEREVTMTGQTTSNKEYTLNKAGFIKATLETKPATLGVAQATNAIVTETGLTLGYRKLLATETYTTASITSTQTFFPFQNGYQRIYAGSCLANDPTKYSVASAEVPKVQLEPGAEGVPSISGVTKNLVEPGLIVLLRAGNKTTSPLQTSPEIYITETDTPSTECMDTKTKMKTVSSPTAAKGDLESPGLPYGHYTVCAQWNSSGTKHISKTIENKNTTTGEKVEILETGASPTASTGGC